MHMTKNFGLGKTVVIQIVEPLKSVGIVKTITAPLWVHGSSVGNKNLKGQKSKLLVYIYKIHILGPLQICFPIFIRVKIAGLYIYPYRMMFIQHFKVGGIDDQLKQSCALLYDSHLACVKLGLHHCDKL